ncbi:MAG TPA: hypothetical protein VME17_18440 [Bryobacteraceae bacterium]|nr:hypothetical protein [Bryobacteraceae bacterium]
MPQPPDNLARDLRAAVLVGDHLQATRLAGDYAQAVRHQWEHMSKEERASSTIPRQSRELLTWATGVTAMQHKMAGQHLAALEMAHRYLSARANYARSAAL